MKAHLLDWKVRVVGAPGFEDFDATLLIAPARWDRWVVEDADGNLLTVPAASVHVPPDQSV